MGKPGAGEMLGKWSAYVFPAPAKGRRIIAKGQTLMYATKESPAHG